MVRARYLCKRPASTNAVRPLKTAVRPCQGSCATRPHLRWSRAPPDGVGSQTTSRHRRIETASRRGTLFPDESQTTSRHKAYRNGTSGCGTTRSPAVPNNVTPQGVSKHGFAGAVPPRPGRPKRRHASRRIETSPSRRPLPRPICHASQTTSRHKAYRNATVESVASAREQRPKQRHATRRIETSTGCPSPGEPVPRPKQRHATRRIETEPSSGLRSWHPARSVPNNVTPQGV